MSDIIVKVLVRDFFGPLQVLCADGKIYRRKEDCKGWEVLTEHTEYKDGSIIDIWVKTDSQVSR
jgi:hypothetical protein